MFKEEFENQIRERVETWVEVKILTDQAANDWYEKHLTTKVYLDNQKLIPPLKEVLLDDWDEDL